VIAKSKPSFFSTLCEDFYSCDKTREYKDGSLKEAVLEDLKEYMGSKKPNLKTIFHLLRSSLILDVAPLAKILSQEIASKVFWIRARELKVYGWSSYQEVPNFKGAVLEPLSEKDDLEKALEIELPEQAVPLLKQELETFTNARVHEWYLEHQERAKRDWPSSPKHYGPF
jgi:hypothetical protein